MNIKRAWHSIRLYTMFSSKKRGEYVRKHKLFHFCGNNVRLPQMLLPLYPEYISLHDNVELASGVKLVVHDAIDSMLNIKYGSEKYVENIGCIEIGNNVFVGANTLILGDVRIGDNVVIGANSLVNKDVPSGAVAAGVPVSVIGNIETLEKKRSTINLLSETEAWRKFEEKHHLSTLPIYGRK